MNRNCFWKSVGAAVLLTSSIGAFASTPVRVTITPAAQAPDKDGDATVNVTLTNTSASTLRVLKSDIDAPLFDVSRYGQQARYLGTLARNGAAADSDYVQLAPGASRSVRVNLSSLYDMHATGAYTVRYHTDALHLLAADGERRAGGAVQSAPVSIWVDGQATFTPDP